MLTRGAVPLAARSGETVRSIQKLATAADLLTWPRFLFKRKTEEYNSPCDFLYSSMEAARTPAKC